MKNASGRRGMTAAGRKRLSELMRKPHIDALGDDITAADLLEGVRVLRMTTDRAAKPKDWVGFSVRRDEGA